MIISPWSLELLCSHTKSVIALVIRFRSCLGGFIGTVWNIYNNFGNMSILIVFIHLNQKKRWLKVDRCSKIDWYLSYSPTLEIYFLCIEFGSVFVCGLWSHWLKIHPSPESDGNLPGGNRDSRKTLREMVSLLYYLENVLSLLEHSFCTFGPGDCKV